MTNNTLIFTHIPKTAGTTLSHIIREQYGEEKVVRLAHRIKPNFSDFKYNIIFIEEFKKLSAKEKQKYQALWGHISFGVHQNLSQSYVYITMLRHPIELTISKYYYQQRSLDIYNPKYQLSKTLNLEDWLFSEANRLNSQIYYLAGVDEANEADFYKSPEKYLQIAKNKALPNLVW